MGSSEGRWSVEVGCEGGGEWWGGSEENTLSRILGLEMWRPRSSFLEVRTDAGQSLPCWRNRRRLGWRKEQGNKGRPTSVSWRS